MVIRSALFNALFWLWIGVLGLAGLPFALLWRGAALWVARIWGKGTLWLIRICCNITYEVRGREHIPNGAAIIASKHQSAWDTVVFWTLLKNPSYVLKRELIYLPVFGWYLVLLKCIYIDRSGGATALKQMLREAKMRVEEKRPIVIFPEGTRIGIGEKSVYHPGVAALYNHLNVPVVPVALNSGLLWKKNAFIKTPGKITIEFLPPIAPGMRGREFISLLQERIDRKCEELARG